MIQGNQPIARFGNRTKGIASFEMVVFLPALFILILILLWICGFGIETARTIVDARKKTWEERYVEAGSRTFETTPFLMVGTEKQFVSEESEAEVRVSKIFNRWAKPKSEHWVLAGTWDHEDKLLDGSPNLTTAMKVAANNAGAPFLSGLQTVDQLNSAIQSLRNPSQLMNSAKNALRDAIGDRLDLSKIVNPF